MRRNISTLRVTNLKVAKRLSDYTADTRGIKRVGKYSAARTKVYRLCYSEGGNIGFQSVTLGDDTEDLPIFLDSVPFDEGLIYLQELQLVQLLISNKKFDSFYTRAKGRTVELVIHKIRQSRTATDDIIIFTEFGIITDKKVSLAEKVSKLIKGRR